MTTIYFAGGGADTFTLFSATEISGAPNNTLTGIQCSSNQYAVAPLSDVNGNLNPQVTSFWANAFVYCASDNESTSSTCGLQFMQTNGASPQRVIMFDSVAAYLWSSSNSSWNKIGTYSAPMPTNTNVYLDVYVSGIGGSSGVVQAYINGVQVLNLSGVNLSPYSYVSYVSVGDFWFYVNANWYSVIVSDTCTIGSYIEKQMSTTAGTYTEWTGSLSTSVPVNTSQGIFANATEQRYTVKAQNPATTINEQEYMIAAVVVSGYVSNTGSWNQNQSMIRYNSNDYAWNCGAAQTGALAVYRVNNTAPDGSTWSVAKFEGIEYGLKSGPEQST